jgi:hypothetical protein
MNSTTRIILLTTIASLLFAYGCTEDLKEIEVATVSQALEGEIVIAVPPLEIGVIADMILTGAETDERTVLVRGTDIGDGGCPASLGGECLGVTGSIAMIGRARANSDGVTEFHWPVPSGAPEGLQFCMQAFIKRGPGGDDSVLSNVVCSTTCSGEGCDFCPADTDSDGICDHEDACPEDETDSCLGSDWTFANYSGADGWHPGTQWNGTISCPVTCDALGKTALGARFICNLNGAGPTEGCDDSNDGLYGDDNCGWMVQDGVEMTLNGNTEDCAGGNIMGCVTDSCTEGVTYHAIECQCSSDDCDDGDGDGVCDLADVCAGWDDTIDSDGDGTPDGCDACPLDPLDSDGDGICDSMDPCPFTPDTDGDGVCDDTDPCPYDFPDDTDGDGLCDTLDPCPDDETDSCPGADWVFGNYPGAAAGWNPAVQWNGDVSCPVTCDALGKTALGARFICNLNGSGPTEGCDDSNDGFYGDDNCGWMVQDGVEMTLNGNTEDCAGGNIIGCVTGTCSEGVTYHAIECQCSNDDCSDIDNDGVCDLADLCEGWDDTIDSDGDGTPDGCDDCPLDPLDSDGDGICDSMDPCPFTPDTDGDGVCDDADPCPFDFPDDTDSDGLCDTVDPCPDDETDSCPGADWVFGNYPGAAAGWNPAVQWNGDVSCPVTCGAIGKTAQGARFICNLNGSGPTEGCDDSNDGFYGEDNCGWMVMDGVEMTLNGNTEDCAGGNIIGCVTGTCSEGVTYHAIECQCN